MNEKRQEITRILDESMLVNDAVISMRGLAVMLDEFLNGNTIPDMSSADKDVLKHIETRIEDMMYFAVYTLKVEADKLSEGQAQLENSILEALSE